MSEPRERVPRRTPRRVAVVTLATLALGTGGGVAWAAWVVGSAVTGPTGPVTSWAVPATETTCTDTDVEPETARVAWPETSTPYVLDYTATIDGEPAPVTDEGDTRAVVIDQALLDDVLGGAATGTLTVDVTAFLPGTSWTAPVATETIEAVVAEEPPTFTLECTA
jgi:hypothetical protein